MNFYYKCRYRPRAGMAEILLVMKLIILLLTTAILQVSASTYGQNVTIKQRNAKLITVLDEIRKQTGYDFFYSEQMMENAKPVNVNLDRVQLLNALEICFKNQPLTYSIENKAVIIKRKTPSFLDRIADRLHTIDVRGRVVDEKGDPLVGATVKVKGSSAGVRTNNNGEFFLSNVEDQAVLLINYLGYTVREIKAGKDLGNITLNMAIGELTEVNVVSTGYQRLPKERATGSFVQIDNELVNRRVSTNILDRLEGVASGIRFQTNIPNGSNESQISIRGRSTIMSSTAPLIVIDNFPYDGDIRNINPNDVENITILKDAAAASIWGSRSSNGVIVITTKKGKLNQPVKGEINANVTIGAKPDLFYSPNFMNPSDFIDVETFLFNNNFYNSNLTSTAKPPLSPVVEILAQKRANTITADQATVQIDALRNHDVRNDFDKYFFQKSTAQQYSGNLSGGSTKATYYFSASKDHNISNQVNNGYDRLTLNTFDSFTPIKDLQISSGLTYTESKQWTAPGTSIQMGARNLYPYAQLADENGNALTIAKDYRQAFKDTTGKARLLDWNYRPLDETRMANNNTKQFEFRINSSARYTFIEGVNLEFRHQYEKQIANGTNLQSQSSYFTRNLINLYSSLTTTGVNRPIPLGDILDQSNTELTSNRLRTQINFDRTIGKDHALTALAGIETGDTRVKGYTSRQYGYSVATSTAIPNLDFATRFPLYLKIASNATIPTRSNLTGTTDINVSYFGNTAYTYKNRYTLSASARFDQSNLFGVDFNQKGVPLWSTGIAWKLSSEPFYKINWLPYAKIRATYGYNGNINKNVTALLTAKFADFVPNEYGLTAAEITNPPNPDLQWEKIGVFNIGLDFETAHKTISGSIDYYHKNGQNLIGNFPVPTSSGLTRMTSNVASMKGSGIDVDLHSNNLTGQLKWQTDFLLSYNTDRVTKYDQQFTSSTVVKFADGSGATINPIVGKPVYGVFSYHWAGLDPSTGDPQGYVNNAVNKNYTTLLGFPIDSLIYHGSARPTYFGSFRNTISYKNLSVSANITYKLGYYFRSNSVGYYNLYNAYSGFNQDFSKRWQRPGDEQNTDVPSMIYPLSNSNRDTFYQYSELLVQKADHIRLQDVTLSYTIGKDQWLRLPLNNLQLYIYANNLGIVWKANKAGLDPDYLTGYPNPRTIAFGVKAGF